MSLHDQGTSNNLRVHPCLTFLEVLDPYPEARYNIECYTDVPKGLEKPKPDLLMRRFPGLQLDEVASKLPELIRLNTQGAGIFTTVNRCTGQRSIDNVTKLRSVHADVDAATEQQRKLLTDLLPPSIIVTSSDPTKLHLYWLLNDATIKEKDIVSKVNRLLASDYGADKAATDIARILRLPGFRHMKYRHLDQTPTVTASYSGLSYSLSEVQATFAPFQISPAEQNTWQGTTEELRRIEEEVIGEIKTTNPALWLGAWEDA